MEFQVDTQASLARCRGLELLFLEQVNFLSKLCAKRSRTGARYSRAGQKWYAGKLACSVRTVGRIVRRLKHLGILTAWQPRKKRGVWQTNICRIMVVRHWGTLAMLNVLRSSFSRRTKTADLASPPKGFAKKEDSDSFVPLQQGVLSDFILALEANPPRYSLKK